MIAQGRLRTETETKLRWMSGITWKLAVKAVCKGTPYTRKRSSGGRKNTQGVVLRPVMWEGEDGCRKESSIEMHCTYYLARVPLMGKDWEVVCCLRSDIHDWTQLDRSFLPFEKLFYLSYGATNSNTPNCIHKFCSIAVIVSKSCSFFFFF